MPVVFPGSSISGTTSTACICCGTAVLGLECRTRGGFATQCGFPGFIDSTNLYRTLTLSGGFTTEIRGGPDCTGPVSFTATGTYSGTCLFNVDTCAETDTGKLSISGGGLCADFDTACCDLISVMCGGWELPAVSTIDLTVLSDTQKQQSVGANPCYGGQNKTTAADGLITLSDLDTPADAIARLLAGAGGTWSSWADPSPGHCQSSWEIPSFFPGFFYIEAQFKYGATGLTPSTGYTLTLDVYQSLYGMGSYTMIGTISSGFTTDGSGNATVTGNVPITQGYDTYVNNPVVT